MSIHGVIPPLVTPLDESGEVDELSLRRLVDFQLMAGVHGLFALGSSGEVSFLDDKQRDLVARIVVEQVDSRVPVLAGAIETSARRVIDRIEALAKMGVSYAVVTAPFYAVTCETDVANHFRYIAKHSAVPVVAYDIPVCVHTKLSPQMLVDLGIEKAIVAVKDSSGDQGMMRKLIRLNRQAGQPLRLFTGTEVVVDANLLMGMDGVVPGLGNVDPAGYVRLYELAKAGNWQAAKTEQDRLEAIFEIIYAQLDYPGPAGAIGAFKQALVQQGIIRTCQTSIPLRRISKEAEKNIKKIMNLYGAKVLGRC